MLAALLNTPTKPEDWLRWSFDDAQDHLAIIQRIRATTGNVTGVTLTNGGSGYTAIPSIVLDSNGSGATFNVSIQGGVIKSLTLMAEGSGYRSEGISIVGGGGNGATATITVNPWTSLPVYPLDPINFQVPTDFLWRHSQTHTEMNGALGLQSIDLSELDLENPNKIQAWIYSNYQEHNNAHSKLGI